MVKKSVISILAVLFAGLFSLSVIADSDDYPRRGMGPGMGPGMMGGYGMGPGMMGGYGMGPGMMGGYGMGPGMMGGYGMGPGMMGGYGMGPGMMGGYGMGPGMMGGQGMGPGMMGGGMMGIWSLDLSDKQRQQFSAIMQEQQAAHFAQMQGMAREMIEFQKLMAQAKPDPKAVGRAYDGIAKLKREHMLSGIKMRNRIYDLLTDEQRQRLYPAQ